MQKTLVFFQVSAKTLTQRTKQWNMTEKCLDWFLQESARRLMPTIDDFLVPPHPIAEMHFAICQVSAAIFSPRTNMKIKEC